MCWQTRSVENGAGVTAGQGFPMHVGANTGLRWFSPTREKLKFKFLKSIHDGSDYEVLVYRVGRSWSCIVTNKLGLLF